MFKVGAATQDWAQRSQLPCAYSEVTTSTNSVAKDQKISDSAIISIYVTEHQTAGRGRGDHTWEDPQGSCLLSSWVFAMNRAPQPVISAAIGLAVYRAFSTTWPWLEWSLKAPNDIYLGRKKVAGLLIENVQEGANNRLIIGLGVNVFSHPDLETATSLKAELKSENSLSEKEWHETLDRLLLELSLAVSLTENTLSETQSLAIQTALNRNPNLKEKYLRVLADGGLETATKKIHWSEL